MSDAKNDAHEAGGKLKRKEYERGLARLHSMTRGGRRWTHSLTSWAKFHTRSCRARRSNCASDSTAAT